MPRTSLTKTTVPGPYADTGTVVTMTAADVANMNQFTLTGKEVVIARNSGATTRNITFTSVNDRFGRTNDLTNTILAGEIKVYGPGLALEGWESVASGITYMYLQADHAEVLFGVMVLP